MIPNDIQRSLAIVIRYVLEHSDTNDPISPHMESVEEWFATMVAHPEPDREFEPDWSTAPDWAMWRATNANGLCKWHEFRPALSFTRWTNVHLRGRTVQDKMIDLPIGTDWRTTLRRRPEAEHDTNERI